MLSITSRQELSYWSGFEVCGGGHEYANDPGFNSPTLKIASCSTRLGDKTIDAREYAELVHLVDDDDQERMQEEKDFERILQDIVYDKNPDWKLVGFRVFPDAVELNYASKSWNCDFQLIRIEGRAFRINIVVPITDEPEGPTEMFYIDISRSYSGDYYADIGRSGDRNTTYNIWYDDTLRVLAPKPKSKVLKFIAKLLFPDFYSKSPTCINSQYGAFSRMYLEVRRSTPLLADNKNDTN